MKVSVAWKCPRCGHRHLWKWEKSDADMSCTNCAPIWMECEKCGDEAPLLMVRIGKNAYAMTYGPLN